MRAITNEGRASEETSGGVFVVDDDDDVCEEEKGRILLSSLGLRKIPLNLLFGVTNLQIIDLSGNLLRDRVRFFSSPSSSPSLSTSTVTQS